ncbi:DNA-binding NarL/FixJ family response regulator [Kibdelosporangium phytohabitans]|nr:DNA-binding NarL/FixJ family response regulator [Kibdelosporangium phytohabitans]
MLVLTTHDTDSDVLPAIEAGAIGYLLKDAPREELFRAVRAAARNESVLSPSVAALLLSRVRPQRPLLSAKLSAREREVLPSSRRAGPTGKPLPRCTSAKRP